MMEKFIYIKDRQPIYQTDFIGAGEQVAFVPSDYLTTGSHNIKIIQTSYKKTGNKVIEINRIIDDVKLTIN